MPKLPTSFRLNLSLYLFCNDISSIDEVSVTPARLFCLILMFIYWMDHVCKFYSVTVITFMIIIPFVSTCRIGLLSE